MDLIRRLLFENLGLKLLALLMAVLVYLNVYTDRPATMMLTFPIQFTEISDSLTLSGPVPAAVQAEIRGTGKQLIRLRLTEPQVRISLAGVAAGRFERALASEDLPLGAHEGLEVERLVGPRMVELQLEKKSRRWLPVAVEVEGAPASGLHYGGDATLEPAVVSVTGPQKALARLDTVKLAAVRVDGRRDTLRAEVGAAGLPDWCAMDPPTVRVTVVLRRR